MVTTLPALVGVGPGCTDETLLSAIASALHTSTMPITGQLSAAVEKNPGVWLNTAQPLCKAFMVTDEDIRYWPAHAPTPALPVASMLPTPPTPRSPRNHISLLTLSGVSRRRSPSEGSFEKHRQEPASVSGVEGRPGATCRGNGNHPCSSGMFLGRESGSSPVWTGLQCGLPVLRHMRPSRCLPGGCREWYVERGARVE